MQQYLTDRDYRQIVGVHQFPVLRRPEGHVSPTFWNLDPPKIDEDGVIVRGGLFPHQRAWWDLPNFIRLLVGGYGSGKTNVVSKWIIGSSLENAPVPVAIVSPTYAMARQTTIATIQDLLRGKETLLPHFHWDYNSSSHQFTVRYHGRVGKILQYSGDNPLALRGPNLAAAAIDEPFIQEQAVFDQIVARVRHPAAKKSAIVLTGTPEQLNWGYDLAEGELADKYDVGAVHASTRANLALPPAYVKRLLEAFDSKVVQAYVEGAFVLIGSGQVYYAFNAVDNVVELPIPPEAELGVGMDFNVNPMAAVVFWKDRGHVHFFDEIELPNADTQFMADTLRDRYGQRLNEVYPDASGANRHSSSPGGRSDFFWLRAAGFHLNHHPTNPARRDRYNAVNGKLKSGDGRVTLTISPRCRKLRKYLSVYSHGMMNRPEQQAMSHLLDAFGYPIAYLFPVDKERFSTKRLVGA